MFLDVFLVYPGVFGRFHSHGLSIFRGSDLSGVRAGNFSRHLD